MGKSGIIVSIIYLLLGAYLINLGMPYMDVSVIPEIANDWISIISGLFLIGGAFFFNKYNKSI